MKYLDYSEKIYRQGDLGKLTFDSTWQQEKQNQINSVHAFMSSELLKRKHTLKNISVNDNHARYIYLCVGHTDS